MEPPLSSPSDKKTQLPGLGIGFEMPRGMEVRYDGEVKDLLGHIAETELRLKGMILEYRGFLDWLFGRILDRILTWAAKGRLVEKLGDMKDVRAYCFEHRPSDSCRLFVIAKEAGLEKNMSLFADGHEAGELLQKIGYQIILQEALKAEGVHLNANQFSGEDFADLCGFLALLEAKRAGDSDIRIPLFKVNREGRERMGRLFGLEPLEK